MTENNLVTEEKNGVPESFSLDDTLKKVFPNSSGDLSVKQMNTHVTQHYTEGNPKTGSKKFCKLIGYPEGSKFRQSDVIGHLSQYVEDHDLKKTEEVDGKKKTYIKMNKALKGVLKTLATEHKDGKIQYTDIMGAVSKNNILVADE